MIITQLQPDELRGLLRDELTAFFAAQSQIPNTNQPDDEIGGVDLAAAVTGYAPATIYTLASKRQIPHSKRGKKLFFSRAELLAWIAGGKRKTESELLQAYEEAKQ